VVHKELLAAHSAQVSTRPHLLAEMRFACLAFSGDTPPTSPDVRPRCSGCFWTPRAEKHPLKHEKGHLSGVFCLHTAA
jgi:hypothetical protein